MALYEVIISADRVDAAKAWLDENGKRYAYQCQYRGISGYGFKFTSGNDAMLFKLVWGG